MKRRGITRSGMLPYIQSGVEVVHTSKVCGVGCKGRKLHNSWRTRDLGLQNRVVYACLRGKKGL